MILQLKQINIVLFAAFCCFISGSAGRSGVCYKAGVLKSGYYTYYNYNYWEKYYVSCGFLGFGRCGQWRKRTEKRHRYHQTTYQSIPYCCTGYTGTAPSSCTPVCNPSCVNGRCSSPNVCSCNAGWTGSICRDDLSLKNWCSSITSSNINDAHRTSIRSGVTVYCGSTSTSYQASETAFVSPKILADHRRTPASYRHAAYQIWKQHPYVRKYCCNSNTNYHRTLIENAIKYNNNFYNFVGGLKATVAIELRKELIRLCSTSLSDVFCPIKAAFDVIDLVALLPPSKGTWTSTTQEYSKAVLVSVLILENKYPTYYPNINVPNKADILTDCTTIILQHIQNKEISKLRDFIKYLPPTGTYKAAVTKCDNDNLCIFMKIIEQARLYLDEVDLHENPVKLNGKKRLLLNTGTDYREFLKQKQLDRILTVLSEQQSTAIQIANELKKHSTTQFTELRSYFEKVETFNQKIADADIAFISGRIQYYQGQLNTVVRKFKNDLDTLLISTTIVAGANVAEKAIRLATDIAEAANPLKFIFGGGSVQDIMDSAAALATAIADVVKMASVHRAFNTLRTKAGTIATNLRKNDAFLANVNNLIKRETITREQFEASKNEFIDKYEEYDPQVTLPELAELTTYWESLIEAACGVLENVDSTAGSSAKSVIYHEGHCEFLPPLAAKMGALYEEIYDYQFDLINAMTAYVRASTSLDAAKDINTEFKEVTKLDVNNGKTLTTLAMMGGMSFVTYQAHVLQTVHLYCNVLEYMEGGRNPPECKGYNTDIALLLANIEPVCISETYRHYYVPTKPSSSSDQAFVNVTDLFAGSRVTFKIPSSQWLVDNEWINIAEKDYAFYVKKFDIFLPTKLDRPRRFYVTADPVLHNVVSSPSADSTEYIIVPHTHLIHEYAMGPSRLNCGHQKIKNPYTSCESENINEICQFSHMTKWRLYPSIFSEWVLTIKGGEKLTVPKPTTDMSAIFGIQLCKVTPDEYFRFQSVQMQSVENDCCPVGQYRRNVTSYCSPCPPGSTSALAGHYCEAPPTIA